MRRLPLAVAVVLVALPSAVAGAATPLPFRAGAASVPFTPPAKLAGDRSQCASALAGPRSFAFTEPYDDANGNRHYDSGEQFTDCNGNSRWDGNLIGGGSDTPRFFATVYDPVGARAVAVSNGKRTIVIEVVDQEGLFDTYQQRIRDRVAHDGVKVDGIFISATHDESAPDTLGLSGVAQTTSSVNAYFAAYLVERSALAIERAVRALRPARVRYAEATESANLRQCWSSYPYVDDQLIPVMQAVDARGKTIATLASVSQHAETLGFNPDAGGSKAAVSSDWVHFLRTEIERRLGGTAIEMAGSVGSVETPEVFRAALSRVPQRYIDESHPAGCRTLFDPRGKPVPIGYKTESAALGASVAGSVVDALRRSGVTSKTTTIWGRRADVCLPITNTLFKLGGALGIFAAKSTYTGNCTVELKPLANGTTQGTEIKTHVAAFRIGDGEFMAVPGEVFPFTFLRSSLGPSDMPFGGGLPPWPLPHMRAPYRFVDGLAEDMVGYIFPSGNGVGVPGERGNGLDPSSKDRFGCGHSDDSEAASSQSGNLLGSSLVKVLDAANGRAERVVRGRYVLPGGARSRDPLGLPVIKCTVAPMVAPRARPTVGVLVSGRVVKPAAWMSLSGRRQARPDRNTRGYFDARGARVWVDVFND